MQACTLSYIEDRSLIWRAGADATVPAALYQQTDCWPRTCCRLLQSPDVTILSSPMCECGSNERSYKCCDEDLLDEMEQGLIWKHLHPDGERCSRCPTCCLLPVILHLLQVRSCRPSPPLLQARYHALLHGCSAAQLLCCSDASRV